MSLGILRMVWERSPYEGQMLLLHISLAECAGNTGYDVSGTITTDNLAKRCRFRGYSALYEALNLMEEDGHIDYTRNSEDEEGNQLDIISITYTLCLDYLMPDESERERRELLIENESLRAQLKEPPLAGIVYLLKSGPYYKIGWSVDAQRRLDQLAIQLPHKTEIIHIIASQTPHTLEQYLHHQFSHKRMNGEWFDLDESEVSKIMHIKRYDVNASARANLALGE